MLRANVGLSQKVSRDFQSTGYTVNLDGEILFPTDDAEAVLEKVHELFNLAQEALDREIGRDQGESAIGRRDEEPPAPPSAGKNGRSHAKHAAAKQVVVAPAPVDVEPVRNSARSNDNQSSSAQSNGTQSNGYRNGHEEPATNKQIQFLLTIGKRFKLSTPQLEGKVGQIIGRKCGIYELTKKEAGRVLDQLTSSQSVSQSA